jgi:hypothetical protein
MARTGTVNNNIFQEMLTRRRLNAFMPSYPEVERGLTAIHRITSTSQQRRNDATLHRNMNQWTALEEREQSTQASNHPMANNEKGNDTASFQQLLACRVRLANLSKISCKEEQEGRLRKKSRDDVYLHSPKSASCEEGEQPKEKKRSALSLMNQKKWDNRFKQLVAYKEKSGHCKIPLKEEEYKTLRNWLGKQREAYKIYKKDSTKGALNADRINKLQSIGVSLEPFSTNWNSRFQELVLFQSQYGHCKVPQRGNSSHTRLGQWLGRQKQDLRLVRDMVRGNISFSATDLERGRLLESVGVRLGECE